MDAPVHYQSKSFDGKRMMAIDDHSTGSSTPASSSIFGICPTGMSLPLLRSKLSLNVLATSFAHSILC
jgi:hypothetical protein